MLLASEPELPADAIPAAGDGVVVLRGPEVRAFAGDAGVLRDDHAPADQLLSPRS